MRRQLVRWTCDLCGDSVETTTGAERPKAWESVRLPAMTAPKSKRTKPRVKMAKLLACPACLSRLLVLTEGERPLGGGPLAIPGGRKL